MPTSVAPYQQLELNAALAVIQWKHAFAIRLRQQTGHLNLVTKSGERKAVPAVKVARAGRLSRVS
jgi:hypothetical protein